MPHLIKGFGYVKENYPHFVAIALQPWTSFYAEKTTAMKVPSRWQLFICSHFNAKLGKLSKEDARAGQVYWFLPLR